MKVFRVFVDKFDCDEYDSFVVVAKSEEEVRRGFRYNEDFRQYEYKMIAPDGYRIGFSRWQAPTMEAIHIEEVDLKKERVICASFNAG